MDESNKRIAKNTVYLYIRQIIIMLLGLFTTSIVLDKLGAENLGINNLVGGFVASFTVVNSILSSGTRRFIALYIGKGDEKSLKQTFATALLVHLIIGVIIVTVLEAFGVWFVNHKLNIPEDRMYAANWVFQLAVVGTFIGVIQTPFEAAVTAHERFKMYAVMSIYSVVSKIVVIFLIIYLPWDKLIVYAWLVLITGLTGAFIYNFYCRRQFSECRWSFIYDKAVMKEMFVFSGWGAFGHVIMVVNGQAKNILLNIFFSALVNAAQGLAQAVNSAIDTFIDGFMTASQPQLVKLYGAGEMDKFIKLIYNVSQFTIFLLSIVLIPIIFEIDFVVNLWLMGNVPEYTCDFVRITWMISLICRSNVMVESGLIAMGRVKEDNMYSVPVYLIFIPILYLALKLGASPVVAFCIGSIPHFFAFLVNLGLLSKFSEFKGWHYFLNIFLKNIGLILLAAIIPGIIHGMMPEGLPRFLIVCSISVVCTVAVIWTLGLNSESREMVREHVIGKIAKKLGRG